VKPIPCTSPRRDHMSWFGAQGAVLTKGYGFRNNSGNLAMFAAIRRASRRVSVAQLAPFSYNAGLAALATPAA
jgi:hypothetical protein